MKRVLKFFAWIFLSVTLLVIACNLWVVISTRNKVFSDCRSLPVNRAALVLGTSHKLANGSPNPFFENRIKMAVQLWKESKVSHFIVSGDNRTIYYNEPIEMKKALVKEGVPDSVITLDYAGLRTLDSIIRSKEIFGQEKITIITQSFHCYRALFISRFYNIDAVAIQADDPAFDSLPVHVREYLARAKAVIDLYVLRTGARHMGEKEGLKGV